MSDDRRRVRRVIEEIGGSRSRAFKIDDPACALLMEHAIEVSKAVLEGALSVAQHRGGSSSNKLEVDDVTLFLGERAREQVRGWKTPVRSINRAVAMTYYQLMCVHLPPFLSLVLSFSSFPQPKRWA